MKTVNKALFTNGDMETTLISQPFNVAQVYIYAVQCEWTGTPLGTIEVQASCDPEGNVHSDGGPFPTTWTVVGGSSDPVSGPGSYLPNVIGIGYNWIRVVFTPTTPGSNAGALNGRINLKGF